MSLTRYGAKADGGGFPRVSGDEPSDRWNRQAWTRFSPRERG